MTQICWRNTREKNQMLQLASNFFVSLCPSDLCSTKSLTPWAIAARLVQTYITESWKKRSPAWTKTPTAHAVPRDCGGLVILSGSQLLRPPPRLHSRTCRGILRNINSRQYLPLLCARCWSSVTFTDGPFPQRPAAPSHQSQCIFYGNCSWPREELKMFWNVPWCKQTDMKTAQQNDLDSTKFQRWSRKAQRTNGDDATVENVWQLDLSSTLHVVLPLFIFKQGLRMWATPGLQCEFKWGDAVPARPRRAGRLTANLLHDFTNHTVHQINTAAPTATKTLMKASLNIWH